MPLVESLQGHGTGWCIAGESTAQTQLANGDFHVYYSLDESGEPTVPGIAIRMQGSEIAEVRGVAHEQNLDSYIAPIAEEKMGEFHDGEKYQKKSRDMRYLTEIDKKIKDNQDLSKEDLRFLYQIDKKIEGFGYENDPRIKELLSTRNIKSDLAFVLDIPKEKISINQEEALSGGIEYHHGNLNLPNLTSAEGLTLPQSIGGDLSLNKLTSAEGLTLPQSIGGDLYLSGLTSAEKQKLREQYPNLKII